MHNSVFMLCKTQNGVKSFRKKDSHSDPFAKQANKLQKQINVHANN